MKYLEHHQSLQNPLPSLSFQYRLPARSYLLPHLFLFQSTISIIQLPLKCVSYFPCVLSSCFSFSSPSSCFHFCSFLFLTVYSSRQKSYLFNCLHLYSTRYSHWTLLRQKRDSWQSDFTCESISSCKVDRRMKYVMIVPCNYIVWLSQFL